MNRACESLLRRYLRSFPCVAVLGPRQCGKTTLLGTLPKGWTTFDLERASDRQLVERDPDLFLRMHPERVAIDEAQFLPALFPALRVAIDDRRKIPGRFVITGSSSPELLRSVSETLAGRLALIEMAPFSCAETRGRLQNGFWDGLVEGDAPKDWLDRLGPAGGDETIRRYWLEGGYPEPWLKRNKGFRRDWTEQYVRTYLERDVARLFPGLQRDRYRLFLHLLGGLSGSMINVSDVARSLAVSPPTARDYFEIAHGSFLWRRLPAYERNALKRVVKHPKGYLRDTGLLHHLLHIDDLRTLLVHPRMGASWEGFVIEEILRGLACRGIGFEAFHYRTGAGAEVDLVLEGGFGLIPIEIKHTQRVEPRQLRALRDFVEERSCRAGIVINNDIRPCRYDEKILGVPIGCL